MVPAFPLDGGRIFRSIVWAVTGDMRRATRWATWGGRGFGALLVGLGLLAIFEGLLLAGLWSAFIGWFVINAASTSFRQFELRHVLARIPVSRAMIVEPKAVPAHATIDDVIEGWFLPGRRDAYPVTLDGIVLGLLHVSDVANVPVDRRATATAAQVMRPTYDLPTANPHESLADVVMRLGSSDNSTALVLDGGRLVGLVDVRDVGALAARIRQLGLVPDEMPGRVGQTYPRAVEDTA